MCCAACSRSLAGLVVAGPHRHRCHCWRAKGMELDSIAAVLIGGTVFGGGKGGVGGTIAGVLILTILFNIFNLLAISRFAHLIIKGVVIVVGIAMYSCRSAPE